MHTWPEACAQKWAIVGHAHQYLNRISRTLHVRKARQDAKRCTAEECTRDNRDVVLLQGANVDAARGLAYLLNANLTISGGCPYPPLSARLAQEVYLPI